MDTTSPTLLRDRPVRAHRKHTILTSDGLDGVFHVAAVLRDCGYRVREFSADVREGVGVTPLTCTVSLTAAESEQFVDRLSEEPTVLSVDRY